MIKAGPVCLSHKDSSFIKQIDFQSGLPRNTHSCYRTTKINDGEQLQALIITTLSTKYKFSERHDQQSLLFRILTFHVRISARKPCGLFNDAVQ
jgi:hypothetical protein